MLISNGVHANDQVESKTLRFHLRFLRRKILPEFYHWNEITPMRLTMAFWEHEHIRIVQLIILTFSS